ncbi:hypothetical protein FZW96_07025 [Bacillus sp. BGMRC 2118]|nr:hypothetical protein FZW96_07025 [Bacillus sp. BGMRC 2118]
MQIPQIQMHSTYAQIGLKTNHAKLTIEQPKADVSIEQPKATLNINKQESKLTIDQVRAREAMDLKSIFKRQEEAFQLGVNAVQEGIARRVSEGEQLMKIENGGNAIATIAKQRSNKQSKEIGKNWSPTNNHVNIQYEPAKVTVDIEPQKAIINVNVNKPITQYSPGNVDITLERRNDLTIDFVNLP